MSDFKAKMHQIPFPSAGALPQTPLGSGSLQLSPGPVAVFNGPTSNGMQGKGERKG